MTTLPRLKGMFPAVQAQHKGMFAVLVATFAAFLAGGWKWALIGALWLGLWVCSAGLARYRQKWVRFAVPSVFGLAVLLIWEVSVRLLAVPSVILPPPSAIVMRAAASTDILWQDFVQTFVRGALSGYCIGIPSAIAVALLVDRSDFMRRGLLPISNFMAALPIVGTAPILVMWFGFDWQSKAAVVVVMVFFPLLVNFTAGLNATGRMERDLMATYACSYWQELIKLRAPAAMPLAFNGLKITTTLALIGAIVAEFFGSPIRGMGFRISTEVGRLALDMVWAEILVAALAGSAFYGAVALVERQVTFWHPSRRR